MKGTELTDQQLDAAEKFILLMRAKDNLMVPERTQLVTQTWDSIVRLVALYGAIRAKAVADGNSPEVAGEVFKTGK